ncbi:MAG: hypothetical protein D6767_07250 [Candidatus Hydrogenedentota bacterium]|nr:MAG: hypothetical protein D6767_07250 [Candidatus Hydrogenedentota bacterium]
MVKKLISFLILFFVGIAAVFVYLSIRLTFVYESKIYYAAAKVPPIKATLVLGASVKANHQPSGILKQRLDAAAKLFFSGRTEKLILSGDSTREYYDEVNTMKSYLLSKKIPPEVIFLDHSGIRTLDSVYRAKNKFLCNKIIIVSQKFHLPRALYLADKVGLEAVGFSADAKDAPTNKMILFREIFARGLAVIDTFLGRAYRIPIGKKISLDLDGRITWN